MQRAIFPGSFDPITLGHVDIISRALPVFEEIIIAVGINSEKKYMFSLEERVSFIENHFKNEPKITVKTYSGLTTDFCEKMNVLFILRGLRNPADFEFEKAIAQTNRNLADVETIFLLTSARTSFISSSIVRDVYRNGGDISAFVPKSVLKENKL